MSRGHGSCLIHLSVCLSSLSFYLSFSFSLYLFLIVFLSLQTHFFTITHTLHRCLVKAPPECSVLQQQGARCALSSSSSTLHAGIGAAEAVGWLVSLQRCQHARTALQSYACWHGAMATRLPSGGNSISVTDSQPDQNSK